MPPAVAEKMSSEQRVRYLLNVPASASYGSWGAQKIVRGGLGERRDFVDALMQTIASDFAGLVNQNTNWLGLGQMLDNSGRTDVMASLVAAFDGHEEAGLEITRPLFEYAAAHSDAAVSSAGKARLEAVNKLLSQAPSA